MTIHTRLSNTDTSIMGKGAEWMLIDVGSSGRREERIGKLDAVVVDGGLGAFARIIAAGPLVSIAAGLVVAGLGGVILIASALPCLRVLGDQADKQEERPHGLDGRSHDVKPKGTGMIGRKIDRVT